MKIQLLIAAGVLVWGSVAQAQTNRDPIDQGTMRDEGAYDTEPLPAPAPVVTPTAPPRRTDPYDYDDAPNRRGELTRREDRTPASELFIAPEFGIEFGSLNRPVYLGPVQPLSRTGYAQGIASIAAGVRLRGVHLGVRYQGSYSGREMVNDMQFHKVYGELGFDWRRSFYVASTFFDFGYSYMRSDYASLNGLGGKAGFAFDFYLAKWFSLGPVASFDVQGFNTGVADPTGGNVGRRTIWVNTLGGTVMARLGFHL